MSRSTVVAGGQVYTVSGLETRARGEVHQAVVTARLVEDATGLPVTGPARMSSPVASLAAVTASDGYVGLAGRPTHALPRLDTTPHAVPVLVETAGHLSWATTASFPAQPTFPATFAPAHLGEIRLLRSPVTLTVSTTELDAANHPVPLPGASTQLVGVWRRLADLGSAPATLNLVALAPGLSTPRPIGSTVDTPALSLPPESARGLTAGVTAGDTWLAVSRRGLVATGDLVALDRTDPGRAEYVEVTAVDGSADPEAPARFELRHPLARAHAAGAPVRRVVAPGPVVSPVALTAAAAGGATTVEVTSLAGMTAGAVVRVSGGTAAPEYRIADRYEITTNADGIGHLPPLTGFVAARVTASVGALTATARVTLTDPRPSLDLSLT